MGMATNSQVSHLARRGSEEIDCRILYSIRPIKRPFPSGMGNEHKAALLGRGTGRARGAIGSTGLQSSRPMAAELCHDPVTQYDT
ncbi:hypothetical protein J1614_012216 [Plenodomus biglobosus]|nr:hypothetical protein J1614_012216 [Plenodomus biglobosus]